MRVEQLYGTASYKKIAMAMLYIHTSTLTMTI